MLANLVLLLTVSHSSMYLIVTCCKQSVATDDVI